MKFTTALSNMKQAILKKTLLKDAAELTKKFEGFSRTVYKCTGGYNTIGYGRNLDTKGISKAEATGLLKSDIKECYDDLLIVFPDFHKLSKQRKIVLIDMRFNLGPNRFRGFEKMIAAVKDLDFQRAADEMVDSKWYKQVGRRGFVLRYFMRVGYKTPKRL